MLQDTNLLQDGSEVIMTLMDKDVVTLLSLAILAVPIAIIVVFLYLILKTMRHGNNTDDPITKLFAKFVDKLDGVEQSVQTESNLLSKLVTSIETGDTRKIKQHEEMIIALQGFRESQEKSEKAIISMKDELSNLMTQLLNKLTDGITLSEEAHKALANEVSQRIKQDIDDSLGNRLELLQRTIEEVIAEKFPDSLKGKSIDNQDN